MLRRPLAAVLSSASIRSRLSSRLFCATAIPTVRTTGILWKKNAAKGDLIGVYWGEGDPRNTRRKNNGPTTSDKARLLSIEMALEQAHKDGKKRIRVQTDLEMDESSIRKMARNVNDLKTRTKLSATSKHAYCERIAKIMDEMEVILEYRKPEKKSHNEVLRLLRKDKNKTRPIDFASPDNESDWTITPSDVSPLEGKTVPTVYATGRSLHSNKVGASATLWVPESIEHLEIKQRPVGSIQRLLKSPSSRVRAELAAIRLAICEAIALNLPEIQVITNSISFIDFFKKGWNRQDATGVLYDDIKELAEMIKVHFKAVRLTEDCDDELLKKVYEMAAVPKEKPKRLWDTFPPYGNIPVKITPTDVSPLEGRTVPTVYVGEKNYSNVLGARASLWVPETIEHLEIKQRPLGSAQRLSIYPVSRFATQLIAIREAIKEAQTLNLPEIRVITDVLPFLHYFTRDWKKADESPVANEDLYLEIKALTEMIKVHFQGARFSQDCDDELLKKVHDMAKEGIMLNKDVVEE